MSYSAGIAALISLCLSSVLLFACLSWLVNHQRARLTSAWLTGLLILVILQSLEFLYHAADWFLDWPFFLKFVDPLVVLIPFALYGYIRALLGENIARPRTRLLLHLSPAIAVALLDIPYWSLPAAERIEWMLKVRISESSWEPLAPYGNDYLAIIALMGFIYWHHQRKLGTALASHSKLNKWIDKLQWLQCVVFITLLSRIVLSTIFGTNVSMVFTMAPAMAWLLYQVLLYTQLPQDRPPIMGLTAEQTLTTSKPNTAEVGELEEGENYLTIIFIELEKKMQEGAFSDNDLSLGKLSQLCGFTTHQVSAAINQCSGSNFYDWLNQYRIQAAQHALLHSSKAVADICFEVGFNSKSTFNTAFKKIAGCTPSQFRKKK